MCVVEFAKIFFVYKLRECCFSLHAEGYGNPFVNHKEK